MKERKKSKEKEWKEDGIFFILESNEGEYLKVFAICPDGISK